MRLPVCRWAILMSWTAVSACGHSSDVPAGDSIDGPDVQASTPLPPIAIDHGSSGAVQVFVQTNDGTNQVVEPDVVYIPGGWHGARYWMAVNPYPDGDDQQENAWVLSGQDGLTWSVPDGMFEPVVPFPSGITKHNSDPDLVFVPDPGRLVLFDRSVTIQANELREQYSDDGVTWSAPQAVAHEPSHNLVSPTVTLVPGRRARLWYVQSGESGCSAAATTVVMSKWMGQQTGPDALIGPQWSAPVATDLKGPGRGMVVWHIDVIWVPEEKSFWAVFPVYFSGDGCGRNDLYVARSRDGVRWTTLSDPLIARGQVDFVSRTLYRSSLVYDAASASLDVWFSGQDILGAWHVGYQAFKISELSSAIDAQRRH